MLFTSLSLWFYSFVCTALQRNMAIRSGAVATYLNRRKWWPYVVMLVLICSTNVLCLISYFSGSQTGELKPTSQGSAFKGQGKNPHESRITLLLGIGGFFTLAYQPPVLGVCWALRRASHASKHFFKKKNGHFWFSDEGLPRIPVQKAGKC